METLNLCVLNAEMHCNYLLKMINYTKLKVGDVIFMRSKLSNHEIVDEICEVVQEYGEAANSAKVIVLRGLHNTNDENFADYYEDGTWYDISDYELLYVRYAYECEVDGVQRYRVLKEI